MQKNKYILIKFIFLFLFFYFQIAFSLVPKDFSVLPKITINPLTKSAIISWNKDSLANTYQIYRKKLNDTVWNIRGSVFDNSNLFVDNELQDGVIYEYKIIKINKDNKGYGYLCTGIEVPAKEYKGRLLLIIDKTVAPHLELELERYKMDLIGDGWVVKEYLVPRSEEFDPVAVLNIKNIIDYEYHSYPADLKAVILFGRIAVPYSGNYAFDGHFNHVGAWPADVYYGIINGQWTDIYVNNQNADSSFNHNIPFDGKFDQTNIPNRVILQIGRIDFYNLPVFKESEIELLRNYLDKNHNFRHKKFNVPIRSIIDDGFGMYSPEAFASNAWTNFSALMPEDSIYEGGFMERLKKEPYFWAYGCNSGAFDNILSIAYADQFASQEANAIFTLYLGSWLGDWNTKNNLLRASIASSPSILGSFFSGRPFWHFHQMSMNESIGFCTVISQNNKNLYESAGMNGYNGIHIALMGDPTIRMYYVTPPENLRLALSTVSGNKMINQLNWDAVNDDIIGYNIYRTTDLNAKFKKLNDSLIKGTFYKDTVISSNKYIYMLKSVKLEKSYTGSFFNESQGKFLTVDKINSILESYNIVSELQVSPNPALEFFNIEFELKNPNLVELQFLDINGKIIKTVFSGYLNQGKHKFRLNLDDNICSNLVSGFYLIKLKTSEQIIFGKVCIIP
ncbi:MAG: T9SS type A sorting domain-containing protein [Candidatus Kapabacteria bacterium]|nr:T9SS type A sorting domain-containing protein [Candidatus Kapabacteria bacterium]